MTTYDDEFFEYVNSGAIRSAERVLPILYSQLHPRSVLDAGCGQGAWLAVWKKLGVSSVLGIDGAYVDPHRLLISNDQFVSCDLIDGFELGRRFDLVQSLEVAEHLPESNAAKFVAHLVAHGDVVLFSAAAKGQGGDHHLNEQSYEYWRQHFSRHGYVACDYIRPRVMGAQDVEAWYRYNPFLYVAQSRLKSLPREIQGSYVPPHEPLRDISPFPYKVRKRIVRLLPLSIANRLAKIKERSIAAKRGRKTGGGNT